MENMLYEQIKDNIFRYRKYDDEAVINPVRMAGDHGVRSTYADFSRDPKLKDLWGYYKIKVDGKKPPEHIIGFRKGLDHKWLHFILAHELGHYFLEQKKQSPTTETSIVDRFYKDKRQDLTADEKETEEACDLFARELCMPKQKFMAGVNYYRRRGEPEGRIISLLSDDFNVPPGQVKKQGVDLGVF